jgi:L-lactate utilization protein LutC
MKRNFKKSQKELKPKSLKSYNEEYKQKMNELMPEYCMTEEHKETLSEKIEKEIKKAKDEQAPGSNQLRQYYLGKQRALEWVQRELEKNGSV